MISLILAIVALAGSTSFVEAGLVLAVEAALEVTRRAALALCVDDDERVGVQLATLFGYAAIATYMWWS